MERARFITHGGKRILFIDWRDVGDTDEALRSIAEVRRIVQSEPERSVLTLTHVKDARFNASVLHSLKEMVAANRPFVKAGAVVGVTGLYKIAYAAITRFSGRNIPSFDTLEAAKEYLINQP